MSAGSCQPLTAVDSWRVLRDDLEVAANAAWGFGLHPCCQPGPELTKYLQRVLTSHEGAGASGQSPARPRPVAQDWRCVMNKRIGLSHQLRAGELVWLDDKLAQVSRTSEIFNGRTLHLPLLGYADEGDSAGLQELRETVSSLVASNQPCVVKPRHGSNSKHVVVWFRPQEAGLDRVWESVLTAASSHDPSWKKESWNQNTVPRGVVVQPLYSSTAPKDSAAGTVHKTTRRRPLELKVQVLFGKVVGACLHTHPQALWVCRAGVVHLWDRSQPGLLKKKHGWAESLPQELQALLCQQLSSHWEKMLRVSEHLATSVGLDELRVDWLLGDPMWGPRIGELTFMGTMALDLVPVSQSLARTYALSHLSRLGQAGFKQAN